jgi:hypothetical protein
MASLGSTPLTGGLPKNMSHLLADFLGCVRSGKLIHIILVVYCLWGLTLLTLSLLELCLGTLSLIS